ncbi:MAG: hypothetical protein HOJ15_00810 [Candidatus Jacksonbacteria bacterium]|jgi:signal transduction histidine kinase|nr:hypothetical protein [Candidatus Jacksonbacteria bacterium]MBT6034116.1 hypothetical protein [Candidatus Jacksonbacteria bacterium]MBT6300953.1 hypothetical protein [Candidatus Jacksonbacteria bacterium]MBT6954893.1 hypothetical protein [Candidatus Jacksonbacteria bacterium]MBT7008190.1 hypothetical protein [Candidatus Jacksonbacteria bacterium]
MKKPSELRHDLRTPLTVIKGYADMLTSETKCKIDDSAKDYVEQIKKSVDKMNKVIDSWKEEDKS